MCMADWPEIKKDRYKAGYRDYQRLNYLLEKNTTCVITYATYRLKKLMN